MPGLRLSVQIKVIFLVRGIKIASYYITVTAIDYSTGPLPYWFAICIIFNTGSWVLPDFGKCNVSCKSLQGSWKTSSHWVITEQVSCQKWASASPTGGDIPQIESQKGFSYCLAMPTLLPITPERYFKAWVGWSGERTSSDSDWRFLAVPQGGNRPHSDDGWWEVWSSVHKQKSQQKQPGYYSALCWRFLLTIGEAATLCTSNNQAISMEVLTCDLWAQTVVQILEKCIVKL